MLEGQKKGLINMAKDKKIELKRVNMNLPLHIVEKVEDYARNMGLNVTSAYIVLLSQALDQKQTMNSLPDLITMVSSLQQLSNSNPNMLNSNALDIDTEEEK